MSFNSSTTAIKGNLSGAFPDGYTGYGFKSSANSLTAAGTTTADALQLAAENNRVTTAALNSGVKLPVAVVGMELTVFNAGANPIRVYATTGETIDGVAGATGVVLTNALRAKFFCLSAGVWISAQLGVISA